MARTQATRTPSWAGLLVGAVCLVSLAGARPPNPTTLVAPSDHRLRCIVNLNGFAANYPTSRWADVPLLTDLSVTKASSRAGPRRQYERVLAMVDSGVQVGTYISGGRVQSEFRYYPPEAVSASGYSEAWLLPAATDGYDDYIRRVNLALPDAAERLAGDIIAAVAGRGRSIVFLDNIVHPSALKAAVAWKDVCRFLLRVRRGVNAQGSSLIANIAVAAWAMSDEDVGLLSEAVDGMAFEMPFHKHARSSAERTRRQIEVYRRWLDAGKIVVLIPLGVTDAEREAETKLIARFAMVVRRPGDRLFVNYPFFKAVPEWDKWPARFGRALGDYELTENPVTLSRQFFNGRITVGK